MQTNRRGTNKTEYVTDYVVFDLETTGISHKNDAIIEISAVKVINGEVVDTFSTLVNPMRPIPYPATAVNGITDDMVISGFHLMKKTVYSNEDVENIRAIAEELATMDTIFYTGHCTGEAPFAIMKDIMGDKLHYIHSGDKI